jgi:hypothetical protein
LTRKSPCEQSSGRTALRSLDRHVAALLAMTILSRRDVL